MLIEGVLFRARYLGSTQLVCEGQPTKSTRMMQAEEAVSRIKVNLIKSYELSFISTARNSIKICKCTFVFHINSLVDDPYTITIHHL